MSLYLSAHRGDTDRLREALHSDRPAIRERASELLGEHADPSEAPTVEALLDRAMNDEDGSVREAAVAALDALGPEALDRLVAKHAFPRGGDERELTVKACGRVLQSDRAELRLAAIHALERLGERSGARFVVEALTDEDQRVRRRAATACGALGEKRCVNHLVGRIDDVPPVRRASIIALGQIGTEAACKALVPLLSADEVSVRRDAARSLGIARYTPALNALLDQVDDDDPTVRGAAFRATMEVLPDLPEDAIRQARTDLRNRLEARPGDAAIDLLVTLTREGRRRELRRQAIWLLGELSEPTDERAIEAMITALSAEEPTVREEARNQLATMGATRVRYRLGRALDRSLSPETRGAIAWILGRIGGEDAIEWLHSLSDDEEPEVRKQAHAALERLGGVTTDE